MTDRPIIFSAPMVLALLREARQPGTGKTQTRRVLTRLSRFGAITEFGPSTTPGYDWHFRDPAMRWHDVRTRRLMQVLPYAVGDRLYVREAWAHDATDLDELRAKVEDAYPDFSYGPFYRATEPAPDTMRWRPSIHMPRWASRLTLVVTEVRVERLNDISEADAKAEGVDRFDSAITAYRAEWSGSGKVLHSVESRTLVPAFRNLWNSLHGPDAWAANPWVVAVTFTVQTRNIDQIAPADALDIAGVA